MMISFLLLVLLIYVYWSGGFEEITLENIQANLKHLKDFNSSYPFQTLISFMGLYIAITSLSIPGAIFLTLLAGYIFGVGVGTVLVSIACTTGAVISFLLSRFLLREYVEHKFTRQVEILSKQIRERGDLFLFFLRVMPASPFVLVNILLGITNIKIGNYIVITFFGMLPGNLIYVYAGKKISEIKNVSEILTWPVFLALLLLGLIPLLIKWFKNQIYAILMSSSK